MQTRNKLLKHAFSLFFNLFSFDDKLGEFYNLQVIKFTVYSLFWVFKK